MQVSDYKTRVALEGVGKGDGQGKGMEEKWVGGGGWVAATTGLLLVSTLSPSLLFLLSLLLPEAWPQLDSEGPRCHPHVERSCASSITTIARKGTHEGTTRAGRRESEGREPYY